jgi:hypothetical protein
MGPGSTWRGFTADSSRETGKPSGKWVLATRKEAKEATDEPRLCPAVPSMQTAAEGTSDYLKGECWQHGHLNERADLPLFCLSAPSMAIRASDREQAIGHRA